MKVCKNCQGQNHPKAYRCRYCNFLFKEGKAVVEKRRSQNREYQKNMVVWNAAVSLFVIGGLFLLVGLYFVVGALARGGSFLNYVPLIIGVIFTTLGILSKRFEFWSILTGTIFFSILYILSFLIIGFSFATFLFFLPFEIYLIGALFKAKRKSKIKNIDILDA